MKAYDLIVVGSGAGLMVLEAALQQGLRCALIEKGKLGGTCLTKGCIPSKMLVYPADLLREAETADRIGIRLSPPEFDWEVIGRRMWEQINFHKQIQQNLEKIPNLTLYPGEGAFTGPHSLRIRYTDGRPDAQVQGERILVAVGARSYVPAIKGLEETGYVTSETFFGDRFPEKPWGSLTILGTGAISLEFAHIFSAFGTKVTVIGRASRILRHEEEDISAFVARDLEKKGVRFLTDSKVAKVEREGGQKRLTVENRLDHSRTTLVSDEILVAMGVRSNADTLAAEKAGLTLDADNWIQTNAYLETSQPHIWALGDSNGKHQFRHVANYEAQVLMRNLFGEGEKQPAIYTAVPWAIFCHPQVAHVGMTEREVREKGIAYRTAKNYYAEVVGGRSMGYRPDDEDNGFVKMIVGEDNRILGAHIVGPNASALLQPIVNLMHQGEQYRDQLQQAGLPQLATYAPMVEAMVIHPSLGELTAWVFEKLGEWPEATVERGHSGVR